MDIGLQKRLKVYRPCRSVFGPNVLERYAVRQPTSSLAVGSSREMPYTLFATCWESPTMKVFVRIARPNAASAPRSCQCTDTGTKVKQFGHA